MSTRQLAMVMDLNKCIGCQTCTVACKTQWTNRNGREYMYWNNVETRPGAGYPRQWEEMGGGFDAARRPAGGHRPVRAAATTARPGTTTSTRPRWAPRCGRWTTPRNGPNWDEDVGAGDFPNSYFFYLPRICNHCTNPGCLAACPRGAIFKRDQDGIVLVDQERCEGLRYCIAGCPYKKIYFNPKIFKSEKCIFCFPRVEKGLPPACAQQCVGRTPLRRLPRRSGRPGPQAGREVPGGAAAPPRVRHAAQRLLRAAARRARRSTTRTASPSPAASASPSPTSSRSSGRA